MTLLWTTDTASISDSPVSAASRLIALRLRRSPRSDTESNKDQLREAIDLALEII